MRKSKLFVIFTACWALLLVAAFLHARHAEAASRSARERRARLVKELCLTDLCLFTEARYTRNPAVTDMQSAFQDHPGALEHFPSGSLVTPPRVTPRAD